MLLRIIYSSTLPVPTCCPRILNSLELGPSRLPEPLQELRLEPRSRSALLRVLLLGLLGRNLDALLRSRDGHLLCRKQSHLFHPPSQVYLTCRALSRIESPTPFRSKSRALTPPRTLPVAPVERRDSTFELQPWQSRVLPAWSNRCGTRSQSLT